jgi:anti-sigma regulatory factor (Ser/Thr protein kinase)
MSPTPLIRDLRTGISAPAPYLCEFDSSVYFTTDPAPLSSARRRTEALLELWGLGPVANDAKLVVSELVTNALVHTDGPAVLQLSRMPRRLRIAVSDPVAFPVTIPSDARSISATQISGRGLLVVAALSCELECVLLRWGKCIAAELNTSVAGVIG